MANIKVGDTQKIVVSIKSSENKNVKIDNTIVEVDVSKKYQEYEGSYVVTSDIVNQTLETKNKILKENIVVIKFPVWETSNDYGTTLYIGEG